MGTGVNNGRSRWLLLYEDCSVNDGAISQYLCFLMLHKHIYLFYYVIN